MAVMAVLVWMGRYTMDLQHFRGRVVGFAGTAVMVGGAGSVMVPQFFRAVKENHAGLAVVVCRAINVMLLAGRYKLEFASAWVADDVIIG